jgi:predicted TPR repeat methyltransferase
MTAAPSSIDELLREAMIAHRAGRMAVAEMGYRRVLKQRQDDPKALHFLGLLLFHEGDRLGGIAHLSRSLECQPDNARGWNALGGMLIAVDRPAEAARAYLRATEVAPSHAEGWYNLGICERDAGDLQSAEAHLRTAIACDPEYFRAHEALAMLCYQLGRIDEAAAAYARWASLDPASAKARHMAAAASGQNVPARASDEYVRELFDDAAAEFETNLAQLHYRAHHSVVTGLVERIGASPLDSVLDAGCGTGLCGPLLRPHCRHLVGVDLSAKMLELATSRRCYDELAAAELTAFMRARPESFDAVTAADTLVYFGALEDALSAAHDTLRAGGWLVFTLEALSGDSAANYQLQIHGRYAHGESYVRSALDAAGFETESLTYETPRQERDEDVRGMRVVARRRRSRGPAPSR